MLLVDDRQPDRLELHVVLHDCVCADDQIDVAGADLPEEGLARGARARAPVSSATLKRVSASSRRIVRTCCSARSSVGAMKATCWPFSIASSAASTATIVLPASDVALQQAVHRLGLLHVFADVLQRAPLARRQMERQHARCSAARTRSSTRVTSVLQLALRFAPPQQQTDLEAEELFEDQPPLRGATETR